VTPMGTSAQVNDRVQVGSLAEEQAALRRMATLVAEGAPAAEVFEAVAQEAAQVMHSANAAVGRFDDDGTTMTILAVSDDRPNGFGFQPGTRWPLDGESMSAKVLRTGRPARVEDYTDLSGSLAAEARRSGVNTIVGAPIVVEGGVWGLMAISSREAPLPDHVEDRLAEFTELVATAIANSQTREDLTRLAEEQAALRRVATLVAQGAAPADVFAAVSAEIARLVPADGAALTRFEDDGTVTALGGWTKSGGYVYVGTRYALEGTVSGLVFETRRPARIDDYANKPGAAAAAGRDMGWRSSVGAPITVEGGLWGVLAVASMTDRPLPPNTERRLAEFTELVATAIANAESREKLTRLAREQAALRRVATRVAQGAPPAEVFEAVSGEVGRLVGADAAALSRYEREGALTIIGGWSRSGGYTTVGTRYALVPGTLGRVILETGRPGRVDSYSELPDLAAAALDLGWRSSVGAPVVVEGELWGLVVVASTTERPLPHDTEGRLAQFTELMATAIANAESRAELEASRARIVATADATRRRVERDLHDGAQQQLLSLALEVRAAQAGAPPELREHQAELAHVADGLTNVLDGLREIALGIHPAILAEGGLGPALKTLAHRSPIPVELEVRVDGRLPEPVEVAAYYVVSEALTNAAKHAEASIVRVEVDTRDGLLRVAVLDDGVGGADPVRGSGVLGLKDRAEAIGGTISLESAHGAGTTLTAELPLDDETG
jgi:signal transduction histidine kinase